MPARGRDRFEGDPLPEEFFARTTQEVARALLGTILVSRSGRALTAGRIVETEAYLGYDDPASHAWQGRRTDRNAALYGPRGSWYVYKSYGIHWCCNLVADRPGLGAAVLLRGIEPLAGVEVIRRRRKGAVPRELGNGPGKLCQALGITGKLDGEMMAESPVIVLPGTPEPGRRIRQTPRIGISKAVSWRLRFVLDPLKQ